MKKFLIWGAAAAAALLLALYLENRSQLKREARRFDEAFPEDD